MSSRNPSSGSKGHTCTATVTHSVQHEVIQSLEMVDCEFISTSPDRPNNYYEVHPRTEIDRDMKTIICSLNEKEHKNKAPRTAGHWTYVQTYMPTSITSLAMTRTIHMEVTDNHLFGMFHANTPQYNKEVILESLTQPDGIVRVVFCNNSLGGGD